jgi:hypothetical protein
MKPLSYLRLLALLAALSFQACETDITDSVRINTKPELVVTAFISPQDTAFEVRVVQTSPVVGKLITGDAARVQNATVRILRGSESVLLTYDPKRHVYWAYTTGLPVVAGQTYSLQVSAPGFQEVTGSCTVPVTDGVALTDLRHEVRQKSWPGGQPYQEHDFSFKWQDAPGRENYYHPVVERVQQDPHTHRWHPYLLTDESKPYYSDEKNDGLVFSASRSYTEWPGPQTPLRTDLHVYLAVTDRAYYLYHQSLRQFQDTDGNPFAEPVLIYSNVSGGLGVFAAYNQLKATYRVE